MSLESEIVAQLKKTPGLMAKELAHVLGKDKKTINPYLYALHSRGEASIDSQYRWTLEQCVPATSDNDTTENTSHQCPEPPKVFTPTPEQQPVITAKADAHLYVEAGPGTGKSETLIARLNNLLTTSHLPPSEILILSFSVAAVKELNTRIERERKAGNTNLSFIDIRTFDSFCSRLLRLIIDNRELQDLDYDERILRATKELKSNPNAIKSIPAIKHVLLDEVQDLVGVRADFALQLLSSLNPGFTLFADSAQAIFDFTIEGGPSSTTSADLVKSIRREFPDLNDTHKFTHNFRVGGNPELERIALHGRALLLESTEKARVFLEKEFEALSKQGSTGAPKIHSSLLNSSTCVVCRTNGQVLRLAGKLHEQQIPFRIARDKNEYLPPSWLGRVFLGWPDPVTVRKKDFIEKSVATIGTNENDAQKLWTAFASTLGPGSAISLRIADIRAALSDGVVMPDLQPLGNQSDAIQLSTIHRAKGREFTNVIVVMSQVGDGPAKGEDRTKTDAEPRVLFVALTRAKKSLHKMEPKAKGIWMPSERWIRSFKKESGFVTLNGFQVGLQNDIDVASFALGKQDEVYKSQQWLIGSVKSGTPVELNFEGREEGCPQYTITIDGRAVGRMSTNFGWAVWQTLNALNNPDNEPWRRPRKFPVKITEIWVKELTTSVGDLSDQRIDRSFLKSGLWVTLTLEGLGKCDWNSL